MNEAALPAILKRLREHPDAPRFNHQATDRLGREDRAHLERYRGALETERKARPSPDPPEAILAEVSRRISSVPWLARRIEAGLGAKELAARWQTLPTMSREDIAIHVDELVPDEADLDRLIVYRTAGTTGHALLVPHAPRAAAAYQPLLEHALSRWGVPIRFDAEEAGCFLVGAQLRTVTYATVLSAWNGCGFAKLNLRSED